MVEGTSAKRQQQTSRANTKANLKPIQSDVRVVPEGTPIFPTGIVYSDSDEESIMLNHKKGLEIQQRLRNFAKSLEKDKSVMVPGERVLARHIDKLLYPAKVVGFNRRTGLYTVSSHDNYKLSLRRENFHTRFDPGFATCPVGSLDNLPMDYDETYESSEIAFAIKFLLPTLNKIVMGDLKTIRSKMFCSGKLQDQLHLMTMIGRGSFEWKEFGFVSRFLLELYVTQHTKGEKAKTQKDLQQKGLRIAAKEALKKSEYNLCESSVRTQSFINSVIIPETVKRLLIMKDLLLSFPSNEHKSLKRRHHKSAAKGNESDAQRWQPNREECQTKMPTLCLLENEELLVEAEKNMLDVGISRYWTQDIMEWRSMIDVGKAH